MIIFKLLKFLGEQKFKLNISRYSFLLLFLITFPFVFVFAENSGREIKQLKVAFDNCKKYEDSNWDSSMYWSRKLQKESFRLNSNNYLIKAFNQIGINYNRSGELDSALFYFSHAKSIAINEEDKSLYYDILYNEAILRREMNAPDSALILLKSIFRNEFSGAQYNRLASTMNDIGNCLIAKGEVSEAIKYFTKAYQLSSYFRDTLYMGGISVNMASEFLNLKLYREFERLIQNAIHWFSLAKSNRGLAFANNLLCEYYGLREKHGEALNLRRKNLRIAESINDHLLLGDLYEGIGATYYHLEKFDSAMNYHSLALQRRRKGSANDQLSSSYYNIASIYIKMKLFKKAILYLDSALAVPQEGNDELFYLSHRLHATADSVLGNFKAASYHLNEAIRFHETYFNDNLKNDLIRKKSALENESKLLKVRNAFLVGEDKLNQEINKQRLLIISIVSVGVLLVLFFVFLYLNRIRKQREWESKLKLKLYESEMDSLNAQINTHFVFNTLAVIQSLILNSKPEEAISILNNFGKLLRSSLKQTRTGRCTLQEEIDSVKLYFELEKTRFSNPPAFYVHLDTGIRHSSIIIPPMLLQPLIENALKHGFNADISGGEINLFVSILDESTIAFQVEDNGPQLGSVNSNEGLSYSSLIIRDRLDVFNQKNKTDKYFLYLSIEERDENKITVARIQLPVLEIIE